MLHKLVQVVHLDCISQGNKVSHVFLETVWCVVQMFSPINDQAFWLDANVPD